MDDASHSCLWQSLCTDYPLFRFAGAIGAEWLKAFKGYIENPTTMLL
jgi:hypothetical protein